MSAMTAVKIPCCLCGTLILPNAANQCGACLAQSFDLKSELVKGPSEPTIYQCRKCRRYQRTPTFYVACDPESPELLAICLKQIPGLNSHSKNKCKVKEASWIWTEPHSMRFKVKLNIQANIQNVAMQQRLMIELKCGWRQCPDCNREFTNRIWMAVVQLRQRRQEHGQKGLLTLEQALRNNKMIRQHVLSIDTSREGLDFYFLNLVQAQAFANFVKKVAPMKVSTSEKLVSTDSHSNTAHRKHNITCELVPLCVQDLVLVEKSCKNNKLAGQLILILKVKSVVHAVSASPTRASLINSMLELSPDTYYKQEKSYRVLQASNRLMRFIVMEVELCDSNEIEQEQELYKGLKSGVDKYALADVTVVREEDLSTTSEPENFCCVTHLGHFLTEGDICLGYDLTTFVGDGEWDSHLNNQFVTPDIVLVKKVTQSKSKDQPITSDICSKQIDSKPKLSKAKQRRRRRKEDKKQKELEEHAERMGFYEDLSGEGDFDQLLEEDPEMAQELQALEQNLAALDTNNTSERNEKEKKEGEVE
mmetsp:Transcript_29145/g.44066  ORF Transcript_29145/g.44066 Transcript_29145/m.44066 type:complete len:534 (-) Transcript_29145:130-1731(-)